MKRKQAPVTAPALTSTTPSQTTTTQPQSQYAEAVRPGCFNSRDSGTAIAPAAPTFEGEYGNDNSHSKAGLVEKVTAIYRDGELYEFLPDEPAWYRRVGRELYDQCQAQKNLRPRDRHRLEFVYLLGSRIREGAKIGPAYPPPTHGTVDEARRALRDAFVHIRARAAAWRAASYRTAA